VPWVMIMPFISGLFKCVSQISANFFQSGKDMSSDAFMNGVSIIGLQIFFISGAMFRISSLYVQVVPPVFGSSLAEIVPPVIMMATFGSFLFASEGCWVLDGGFAFSVIFASRISFSLIPML